MGRLNSVDSSAPTILKSMVRIPNSPSMHFQFIVKFCNIFVIVLRKERKFTKRGWVWPIYNFFHASSLPSQIQNLIFISIYSTVKINWVAIYPSRVVHLSYYVFTHTVSHGEW